MFKVRTKDWSEYYLVYATKTIYESTLFLVYHDGIWDWCNANLFVPCD
jgi:hypothetical protein